MGMTNLTNHPADEWWPSWSPDGERVVFHSDRDDNFEIYVVNVDGSGETRLTDHPSSDYDPDWSPDGEWIGFTSDRSGDREIMLVSADGTETIYLTYYPTHDWAPAWRPSGTILLAQPAKNIEAQEEIEIAQPGTNLARRKQVRVSRALTSNPAHMAVDGNPNNWWGAGAFAPQWIEVDLEASYIVAEIRMLPSQSPAGKTIHRLFVKGSATNNEYELLHTFEEVTRDSGWLTFKLPEPLRGIRYIRIETISSPSWVSWREIEVIAGE
jgi:hypothetical protein